MLVVAGALPSGVSLVCALESPFFLPGASPHATRAADTTSIWPSTLPSRSHRVCLRAPSRPCEMFRASVLASRCDAADD